MPARVLSVVPCSGERAVPYGNTNKCGGVIHTHMAETHEYDHITIGTHELGSESCHYYIIINMTGSGWLVTHTF